MAESLKFRERIGLQPTKALQIDDIDDALRNRLWNCLHIDVFTKFHQTNLEFYRKNRLLMLRIWDEFFGERVDKMPNGSSQQVATIESIYFSYKWFQIYEFLEFIANNINDSVQETTNFVKQCNFVLQGEGSAYRFVGLNIAPIIAEEEISQIEQAIDQQDTFSSVSTHIQTALRHMSDRQNPDFRNSIKESISAVEAMCKIITGDRKATLSQALKKLDQSLQLHPTLKASFEKLYAYTSDAEGIRHALLDESNLTFDDAKYMLVCCSAFVNYLKSKAAISGINV